jgi:hypothetical protein
MTFLRLFRKATRVTPIMLIFTACAMAEWKAANPEVAAAAKEPKIASVLEAVNAIDAALIADDHAHFILCWRRTLVVNNPQNGISIRGPTRNFRVHKLQQLCAVLRVRGDACDMVLLMGDERVVPKGNAPMAGKKSGGGLRMCGRWRVVIGC